MSLAAGLILRRPMTGGFAAVGKPGHTINKRLVRKRRQFNSNQVARLHHASLDDDTHNARLTDESCRCGLEDVLEETGLERFDLAARIAEAGQLDDRFWTESKAGADRQLEQFNIPR
jgi:hypothetical protein